MFTAEHEAFWAAARTAHGDAAGTRELIEVLLLHRHLLRDDVLAGLRAATSAGATRADVVAVEARRLLDQQPADTDDADEPRPVVVSLTQRRLADPDATIAALPPDRRSLPTVNAYDELLTRRPSPQRTSTAAASGTTAGGAS